jgi:adenosylcobinamide-GDP ribazoletransferase
MRLKDLKNCFSFLTCFPISENINIEKDLAPKMWLFPMVGFVLGLISSFASLLLFKFLPFLLVGFITLGLLLLMTGCHHTDGLIDFGDGLMTVGSPKIKIKSMHDIAIGVGGFTLGFIILTLSGLAISYSMNYIIIALVISEIGAKFGMVAACSIEKTSKTKMAESFILLNKKKDMLISFLLSLVLIYLTLVIIDFLKLIYQSNSLIKILFVYQNPVFLTDVFYLGLIIVIFILGTFIPLIFILKVAKKNFNSLTGDCLGALNDITRLFILLLIITFNEFKFI